MRNWLQFVPIYQFGLDNGFIQTVLISLKQLQLSGTMSYLNSNLDKNIYLSTYVEMILRLDDRFCLSMPQLCEVILRIAWLNSTYKYWWILQSCVESGQLPVSYPHLTLPTKRIVLISSVGITIETHENKLIHHSHVAINNR